MFRTNGILPLACVLAALSGVATAQQAAAPAAAPVPGQPPGQQFSINESVNDWVVRCIDAAAKSPAPCEVIQTTINRDTNQRLSAFSMAFIPSRDVYATQIVVPSGVALARGLQLGTTLTAARFTRCERDGCYMETLLDNATITSLVGAGASTTITVYGYGAGNEIKLPVSLNGFSNALDRMKGLSRQRAVALPANQQLLPAAKAPAAAPAAAAPLRPGAPAPAKQ